MHCALPFKFSEKKLLAINGGHGRGEEEDGRREGGQDRNKRIVERRNGQPEEIEEWDGRRVQGRVEDGKE